MSLPPQADPSLPLTIVDDPRLQFAEPNYIVTTAALPNDPSFDQLWGLHNLGQDGGTLDADIDAPEAWDLATGSTSVVAGVIDTGVDYTHPDLYRNVWLNQDEIPSDWRPPLDADSDQLITFGDLNNPANAGLVSDINGTGYINGGDLLPTTIGPTASTPTATPTPTTSSDGTLSTTTTTPSTTTSTARTLRARSVRPPTTVPASWALTGTCGSWG